MPASTHPGLFSETAPPPLSRAPPKPPNPAPASPESGRHLRLLRSWHMLAGELLCKGKQHILKHRLETATLPAAGRPPPFSFSKFGRGDAASSRAPDPPVYLRHRRESLTPTLLYPAAARQSVAVTW